jgi:hypothetical protein
MVERVQHVHRALDRSRLGQSKGVTRIHDPGSEPPRYHHTRPLLSGPSAVPALLDNLTANTARNIWSHTIILCSHFADGAEEFTEDQIEGETQAQWYLRQVQESANIEGSPLFHVMSGNLSHQIEHHLFPDLPSNRHAEIASRVRAVCERYGLPYTHRAPVTPVPLHLAANPASRAAVDKPGSVADSATRMGAAAWTGLVAPGRAVGGLAAASFGGTQAEHSE